MLHVIPTTLLPRYLTHSISTTKQGFDLLDNSLPSVKKAAAAAAAAATKGGPRSTPTLSRRRGSKSKLSATAALEQAQVKLLEGRDGSITIRNLSQHRAESEMDAMELVLLGDRNRHISETLMNDASSRSHCIFTVTIESRPVNGDVVCKSKLHFVDLAGSERTHKTKAEGATLNEAKYINTSLHFLELVIITLQESQHRNRQHIPYRNSMLTSVLRDSLGGNCKTTMVATIHSDKEQTEESISTCRFAQRVAKVENKAVVNAERNPYVRANGCRGSRNIRLDLGWLVLAGLLVVT